MLKFGLVGCGRIAKRHADLLGLNQIQGAQLVCVCDVDKIKANKFSKLIMSMDIMICMK